ncbi:probable disease resistance protein At4g27220 isoform X2 [Mangifera indica]|uniref:probable disease resistance protein At4g27220 isoform X2 n=1 Tax=Mangifera indica TaxID=29780 RepID=UPI001CFB67AF|nr:probable disease resistance protein At4g27220 isoform X2 [Mangifera indica]
MVDVAGDVCGVVSAVLEVGKWLAGPIWRPCKYLYNYTTNFKNLEMEVDKLKNTRDEVERKIIAAERNVEVIKQNVKDWQKNVGETITKAEQLIQEKEIDSRCFKGLSPNFIIHYKQSRKAFKLKRDDIDPLLQQEGELSPVSYQTNPPDIWLRPSENYLAFESRNSTVKNVWDALNDENVFMIGVYGMGGLGKTTLVEELGRKAEKDKLFEDIVFLEVSESPDVNKIQTTIGNKLGLKFKNENESEMANKIYLRMKDKNILLILDNIWEPLEFEKTIGIPCGADRGRNKLLFTTRNLDVLERMGSTNNFQIGILNEEEAWTLFTKMAGNIIQTRELHSLPNDICKECKGLPIVICTIAKALKNKSRPYDWNYALQELRAPSPAKFTSFLEEDYTKIALSYKYLRDDELKKMFLISSLMENNTSISDLFRHVVCLDVFDGVNLTMKEARDRLDKLVCDLKDACLLLDGFKSGQFAMHDVVRVVAITIAYVDHHVFTPRNDIERDWKNRDKLKKCTKISLPGNSTIISQLWPNDFDCPNLEYFHMTNMRNSSLEIPEDFFTKMPKLRVLNLDGLQQSSLPSSIDILANLQTLCLDYSKVEDVVVIGRLKKLKVLSLLCSNIKEFPMEMGQLTQLRLLDLSDCYDLKVIAPNVLSKLSQLEELYLKGCCIQWKIEVLEQLKLLSSLSSLELDIEDEKVLPKNFISRELIRYNISVGDWSFTDLLFGEHEHLRMLELIIDPTINLEELCVIKNVELLCLAEYLDDENENEDEDEDEDNLKPSKFNLQSTEITPLFNKKVIFPDLKVLALKNIISRKIWDSELPSSSFQKLKELILRRCTKIKFVFPYAITKNLQQLQYLEIKDCIDLRGNCCYRRNNRSSCLFCLS